MLRDAAIHKEDGYLTVRLAQVIDWQKKAQPVLKRGAEGAPSSVLRPPRGSSSSLRASSWTSRKEEGVKRPWVWAARMAGRDLSLNVEESVLGMVAGREGSDLQWLPAPVEWILPLPGPRFKLADRQGQDEGDSSEALVPGSKFSAALKILGPQDK